MPKGTGKREKEFCNSTCRSNFWYAKNKKGKEKAVFVQPTPESFDGAKASRLLSDEFGQTGSVEPLSFDKLRETPLIFSAPKNGFKSFQQHMNHIATLVFPDDRHDYISVIQSDGGLSDKQKELLITNIKNVRF